MATGQSIRRRPSISELSPQATLAVAIVIGLALRVFWNLIAPVHPVSDFLWYFKRATWLAEGFGYIATIDAPTAFFPVGYPAFLAGIFVIFGPSLVAAKAANILISTLTIWIVYQLTARMLTTENPRRARIQKTTVLLFALFPSQILYTALVSDSALFQFLLCGGVLVLLPARPGLGRLTSGGIIFGLATLTRPYTILVPAVVMVIRGARAGFADRMGRQALVYAVAFAVLIPWGFRNARELGGFVLVSTNGGVNLLIGNGAGATGSFTAAPLAPFNETDLSEYEVDRLAWSLGKKAILEDPLRFVGLVPKKILYMFADDAQALRWNLRGLRPDQVPIRYSLLEYVGMGAVQLYYMIVLLGSLAFIALGVRRGLFQREVSAIGFWIMAVFTCVAIVFFGDSRFHFPLTPFLCFYAACSWEAIRHGLWKDTAEHT